MGRGMVQFRKYPVFIYWGNLNDTTMSSARTQDPDGDSPPPEDGGPMRGGDNNRDSFFEMIARRLRKTFRVRKEPNSD